MIPAPIITTSLERGIGLSFDVPTNPTPRGIGGLFSRHPAIQDPQTMRGKRRQNREEGASSPPSVG
jgi:hypothetical protein